MCALICENKKLNVEWNFAKNVDSTPETCSEWSKKKVWWICKNNHDYEASPAKRMLGQGCPYCSGKKVLIGYNDLQTRYPVLSKEWNYKKNDNLTPQRVTAGSNKKVWWKCSKCGHEWETTIAHRSSGEGCPCCGPIAKTIIPGKNDLKTTNPGICNEWDYKKNKIKPEDVSRGSNRSVYWICAKCSSSYEAKIASRINGTGCPFCAGKKIKPGLNDLATRYPEVAKYWDYQRNDDIKPTDVFPHSEKMYWWKCDICGHEWKDTPDHRTNRKFCPNCTKSLKTSFPEQAILFYLMKIFPDVISRDTSVGVELDIFIPSINTAVEYDGCYYHKDKNIGVPDEVKDNICLEKGIKLFRIREPGLSSDMKSICIMRKNLGDSDLSCTINKLFSYLGLAVRVDVKKDQTKILAQYSFAAKNDRLSEKFPELAREWNYPKNGKLLPSSVHAGSGKIVWWKCKKCGGEWKARIFNRSSGQGCPYCCNQKVLVGYNDLASKRPKLAEEWSKKNFNLSPKNCIYSSNKKVWWKCRKCGKEWKANISSRSINKTGCPSCSKKQSSLALSKRKLIKGEKSFKEVYPELSKEWDVKKNDGLLPSEVTFGSGRKVWWRCSNCGKSWMATISNRARYNKIWCNECRKSFKHKVTTKDKQIFKDKFNSLFPDCKLLSDYLGDKNKILILCSKCGNTWSSLPDAVLHGKGCPACARARNGLNRRKNPAVFKEELSKVNENLELLEKYIKSDNKILVKCKICGHQWKVLPSKLLSGRNCPKCSKNIQIKTLKKSKKQFVDEISKVNPDIEVIGEYINARTKIRCRCKICNYEWESFPTNMLRGVSCKKCRK